MTKNFARQCGFKVIAAVALMAMFLPVFPYRAYAQTTAATYQPANLQEVIAYLYGVIATLEAQIAQKQGSGSVVSSSGRTIVSTLTPSRVHDDEAILRGEVTFGSADYVYVYFDYGTDSSFDDRTSRVRTSRTTNTKSFSAHLEDLRDDRKYYYRAVVELPNGTLLRGSTRTFTTDEYDEYDDDDYRGSGDIDIDDDEYRSGDTITVEVDLPSSADLGKWWIGLYEEDANDRSYLAYRYIYSRDQRFTFTAPSYRGQYEFRIFANENYDRVEVSDSFEVR